MNSLSWMIYLAEIVGNVQGLLSAIAFGGALVIGLLTFLFSMFQSTGDIKDGTWRVPLKFVPIVVIAAFMAVLTPSSRAIYMIAASEAGETIVTSPEAKDMLGDLKEIIRRKLKEQLAETGV